MPAPAPSRAALVNRKVVDVFLAQEETAEGGSFLVPLLMIVGLFAVFYFLLIRPQRKRRDQQLQLQSSLAVGDEVVTIGGLYGTIAELDDQSVILETSEGVYSRYARGAISQKVSDTGPGSGSEPEAATDSSDAEETSGTDTVVDQRDTKD